MEFVTQLHSAPTGAIFRDLLNDKMTKIIMSHKHYIKSRKKGQMEGEFKEDKNFTEEELVGNVLMSFYNAKFSLV